MVRIEPGPVADGLTALEVEDDFESGTAGTGNIGRLGWTFINGSVTDVQSEDDHPGIVRRDTSAVSGTITYTRIKSGSGVHTWAEDFDCVCVFRATQVDANTKIRVGPSASHAVDGTATDAAYLEKLGTDTNWFFVTRGGSAETRANSGVAADTGWHKIRIRRVSATSLGFTLDAGAEVVATGTLPTGAVAFHGWQIVNTAAAAKTMDVDYFRLRISGLAR